ncbi:uncharacterized protein [Drosophila suzukii]|uniref:MADF domain-containing protein n=1 Tax=Drosophila suzukii TaxID=28584 RepID=A0AB40A628_DROSZ
MNSRDREFWTEFLLLYRSLPAVWQIHSTEYSSRALKSAGYDRLIRKLREVEPLANRSLVVRKINSFRTNFRRDIRRRDSCSAAGESFQSTLWYFDLLGFLEGQDEKSSNPKADRRTNRHVTSSPESSAYTPTNASEVSPPKKICRTVKEESQASSDLSPLPEKSITMENVNTFSSFQETPEQGSTPNCFKTHMKESDALAQTWSNQFDELSHDQRIIARKLISDILYYGCMEQLKPGHVDQMHQLLKQ